MTNQPNPGDKRRAVALIQHHHGADVEGINDILATAAGAGRVRQLVVSLLNTYEWLIPALYATPDALVEHVSEVIAGTDRAPVVAVDLQTEDLRRAARLILEHTTRDDEAANRILFESPTATPLVVAVMSLYSMLVPALNTHVAAELLQHAALDAAAEEAAEGE